MKMGDLCLKNEYFETRLGPPGECLPCSILCDDAVQRNNVQDCAARCPDVLKKTSCETKMKCDKNSFYNDNAGDCFSCSDICDNLKATGNSKENCLSLCPGYTPNHSLGTTTDGTSYHLEIIMPVVLVLLALSVVIISFIIRHSRNRQRVVDTEARPCKWTKEEVGDDGDAPEGPVDDSGIDTHRVDTAHRSTDQVVPLLNESVHQETGLSEMPFNFRYLRDASDASGAQEL